MALTEARGGYTRAIVFEAAGSPHTSGSPANYQQRLASVAVIERVLLAAPRGFCAGVDMAIKALTWMIQAFDPPVYCYHEIIHNRQVVRRFEQAGVVFVDDIATVPEGRLIPNTPNTCLLYTSPSPRDRTRSRMPSSA